MKINIFNIFKPPHHLSHLPQHRPRRSQRSSETPRKPVGSSPGPHTTICCGGLQGKHAVQHSEPPQLSWTDPSALCTTVGSGGPWALTTPGVPCFRLRNVDACAELAWATTNKHLSLSKLWGRYQSKQRQVEKWIHFLSQNIF